MKTNETNETNEFFTDPKMAIFAAQEAMKQGLEILEKAKTGSKKGDVGNIVTADTIMSYSCTHGKTICVSARKNTESLWDFEGVINGELVIRGEIYGGKWKAARYAKFIRNGLLSRANRGHATK